MKGKGAPKAGLGVMGMIGQRNTDSPILGRDCVPEQEILACPHLSTAGEGGLECEKCEQRALLHCGGGALPVSATGSEVSLCQC